MKKFVSLMVALVLLCAVTSTAFGELILAFDFDHIEDSTVLSTYGDVTGELVLTGEEAVAEGKIGNALKGGSAHVNLPEDFLAEFTDFTFTAWVYWNDDEGHMQRIFDFGHDGGDPAFWLSPNWQDGGNHGLRTNMHFGGDPYIGGGAYTYGIDMEPGEWIHLAVTLEDNVLILYQNGELLMRSEVGPFDPEECWPLLNTPTIGGHSNPNHRIDDFNGLIDEVYIFNEALTKEDIIAIMNDGYTPAAE